MPMFFRRIIIASGLILIGAIGVTFSAHAQNLELGLKVGAGFNQTNGTSLSSEFNGNFLGGAFVGVRMAKIKLQADVLFSQSTVVTGSSFNSAFKDYIQESAQGLKEGTFKMNELSIPITLGIRVVPKILWLELGAQYTGIVSVNDVNSFLTSTEDVFKNGYTSAVIGVSADLPFNLNIGARYLYGLSNKNNTNVDEKWGSNVIQLHVGYSFIR